MKSRIIIVCLILLSFWVGFAVSGPLTSFDFKPPKYQILEVIESVEQVEAINQGDLNSTQSSQWQRPTDSSWSP